MLINEDLKKIFGAKYYQKMCNYIEVIQNVINSYDVVIFMARKAYCLYLALKDNDLILHNSNCVILSSRAVTYNGIDFSNKKVAIIEDVVILGEALSEAINEQKMKNIQPDIYMLACSSEFSLKKADFCNKFNSASIMEKNDLLELATLITNYIIYEMIPYNTDYPTYVFEFSHREEINQYFNKHNLFLITDLIHCKNHSITEGVIMIDNETFDCFLPKEMLEDSIFKIRVYIDYYKRTCYLTPIVIFSQFKKVDLENMFTNVFSDNYSALIELDNSDETILKNKLRILCYTMANSMLFECFHDIKSHFSLKKISSEQELFSIELLKNNDLLTFSDCSIKEEQIHIDENELYNSLGYAYDLLINNFKLSFDSNFKSDYISFQDIKQRVSIVINEPHKVKVLSSLILDVFIDNGVVVPRIKLDQDYILRMFKFGEVAKLTANDFVLFAMVLSEYSDGIKRGLDKTEIEKISVIFFRRYNNNFNVEDNEAEAFRICYSKFGPRISSSDVQYSISQGQALSDILIENNYITRKEDKFDVCPVSQEEEKNKVNKLQRSMFTGKLKNLYEYYILAQKTYPENGVFKYINSYIRLLTLLSIGGEEQDKLLSLIAEVDLIKCKTISKHNTLFIVATALNSIIDGVLSGIWKFCCYNNDSLQEIFKLLLKDKNECKDNKENDMRLYSIDIFLEIVASEKPLIENAFFFEIGQFLYDVAIFNMYLCKYINFKIHDDYKRTPYKNCFNTGIATDINEYYKEKFACNKTDELEIFIFENIKRIDNISCKLLDKFHIYNTTMSLQCETFSDCIVIFSNKQNNKVENNYPDLITHQYNNALIIPLKEENKKFVLNRICNSLNDVNTKALYYSSNDENILFYSTGTNYFGKKFIEGINCAIRFAQKNITPIFSKELLILPKEDFTIGEFSTGEFSFKYNEKISYLDGRNIYKYNFKEKKSMNVTTLIVNGTMYNVEQVSGDFNLLHDQCTDATIQEQIKRAKEATEKKDVSKLQNCLTWLKENAFDFIKEVGTGVLIELINSGITQ